jgi:uncharacterized protein (DUF885 family)
MPDDVRTLADELHLLVLARDPFGATVMGVPGHDAEVPDVSREADEAHRSRITAVLERAVLLDPAELSPADLVTLTCVRSAAERELADVAAATVEYTVSPLSHGPARVAMNASRAVLTTPEQAADYLTRTGGYARYLDGCAARLREGAARDRPPVGSALEVTLAQVETLLEGDLPAPLVAVEPPAGWDGADAWRSSLVAAVRDEVRPALVRYRDLLADELRPVARADDRAGLVHLDGGLDDYASLVRVHTTLPLTPDVVHATGQEVVAELRERMLELGARLDLPTWESVLAALRAAATATDATTAMALAREAVQRAEAAVPAWFSPPLPPPCRVEAMEQSVAAAGMPPHYTLPSLDGTRQGTYWFNAEVPGAGSGWDLEATAYHEAVPGHHLQLSRMLGLTGLPALQTQTLVTAHAEGWGLYAEVLAGEMGLYSTAEQQLGALGVQLFRAARLVVDTGLHALGWSREEATDWFRATVPLPEPFLVSEIGRYIGIPGQALAYLTGQREILLLRAEAQEALGSAFDIRGFHDAVLGSGALPLPALRTAVGTWVDSLRPAAA